MSTKNGKSPARPLEELVVFIAQEIEAISPSDPEDERIIGFEIRPPLRKEVEQALAVYQDGTQDEKARGMLEGVIVHLRNVQCFFIRKGFNEALQADLNRMANEGLDLGLRNRVQKKLGEGKALMAKPNEEINLVEAGRLFNEAVDLLDGIEEEWERLKTKRETERLAEVRKERAGITSGILEKVGSATPVC